MELKNIMRFILIGFGVLLLIFNYNFWIYENDFNSVTFWVVNIGTILLICIILYFIYATTQTENFIIKSIFGDVSSNKLKLQMKLFDLIGLFITASIVSISLLWGLFVSFEKSNALWDEFQNQTTILICFIAYTVVSLIGTFGQEFKK